MMHALRLEVLALSAALVSHGSALANAYQFDITYTGDVLSNVSGGVSTGSEYLDNLDVTLEIDVAEMWGFGSGRFFVYGLYNNGATFSEERVGDLQVVSNIDAERALRLYELWYEYGDERWSIRTGLYDLNSEFDTNETSGLFINSSHGIGAEFGQTGMNGPSIFPVTSLSVRGEVRFGSASVRVAFLDGVPGDPDDAASNTVSLGGEDGVLSIAELDLNISERSRVWTGAWRYSAEFERLNASGSSNSNSGWYAGIETDFNVGSRSVAGFLRYGQANDRINPIRDYIGAGLVMEAPLASRPDDQVGVAVASARVGEPYRDWQTQLGYATRQRETAWELSYRAKLGEHFALQPDIQFIDNPAASANVDDALVFGLRFEISY